MVVKITKAQFDALQETKAYYGLKDFHGHELILLKYLQKDLESLDWQDIKFLYNFNIIGVMDILLGNYEVKKEGIDLVSEEFFSVKNNTCKSERDIGYLTGIQFAVKKLGFKLKE